VVITNEGDKQRITASTDLLFATVSTKLSSEGMAFLTTLTTAIQRQKELIRRVEVQGHTDATPINPNSYDGPFNLELAGLRAARVVRFMQAAGLDPADTEMVATSFGEYRPLAPDGSHRGRAVNRRVEILLTVAGPHLYQQMYEELFGAAVINANSE
jgi:chemotaxis protein MotB